MQHRTCEFLTLKTLSEGIVKIAGLGPVGYQFLTGSETEAFKAKLELRALTRLGDYLKQSAWSV